MKTIIHLNEDDKEARKITVRIDVEYGDNFVPVDVSLEEIIKLAYKCGLVDLLFERI